MLFRSGFLLVGQTRFAVQHGEANSKQDDAPGNGKGADADPEGREDGIAEPEGGNHDHGNGDGGLNANGTLIGTATTAGEAQKNGKVCKGVEQGQ